MNQLSKVNKYMDYNDHHQDINNPFGFIVTLCFLSISIMIKMIEINLPEIDTYLIIIVHISQLVAALLAIVVGYITFKRNNRNKPI